MKLWFLGVRGSSPASGPDYERVGGHTCCVAVAHDGAPPSLILDAGTGLRTVRPLLNGAPFRGTIILGHLHWDHVMGLPFFGPADHPDAHTRVLVPEQGTPAKALLAEVMRPPFFPIGPDALRGNWTFATYDEGRFETEGFRVVAREIPHKGGRTMGLQISDGTHSIAYLSDHAPQEFGVGPNGSGALHDAARELASGVDVLIHDSQYTVDELPDRGSFGHAAAQYSVELGRASGAKRVMLFHHDPWRTDPEVDSILDLCRALPTGANGASPRIDVAVEGLTIDLSAAAN